MREYTAPAYWDSFQAHNSLSFKLVKTVADFTQQLSDVHERHAEELQRLVENFRKRNADIRKERSNYKSELFNVWELLLQEVEVDSQLHGDICRCLNRQLGTALLAKTFHKKIQSRKLFAHRDSLAAMLAKADELLEKCHEDYVKVYQRLLAQNDEQTLCEYYEAHNSYVQQMHAANEMGKLYSAQIVPVMLDELRDIYGELSSALTLALAQSADCMCAKVKEQVENYELLANRSKQVNWKHDLQQFIKALAADTSIRAAAQAGTGNAIKVHTFLAPALLDKDQLAIGMQANVLLLPNEIILGQNKMLYASKIDSFRGEIASLEAKMQQLDESLDSLARMQRKSVDSSLYNKVNEIQEDISAKRFEYHMDSLHAAALRSQISLILGKEQELAPEVAHLTSKERKGSSSSSTSNIKMKWLKAFKSLKTPATSTQDKGMDSETKALSIQQQRLQEACSRFQLKQHVFQEYTYKKLTACDVCGQILRGHSKQGLKCKVCKLNVHINECQDRAPKCQQSKSKLLRRQKSTSEIETSSLQIVEDALNGKEDEQSNHNSAPSSSCASVDPVYLMLRAAVEARRGTSSQGSIVTERKFYGTIQRFRANNSPNLLAVDPNILNVSCSAPHSPQRKKMSLRMKSFSLDESNPTALPPSSTGTPPHLYPQLQMIASSQSHRKNAFNKVRMSSVEVNCSNDHLSSSSSPCLSPVIQKPQRLLPTNLYVALFLFKARQEDELSLKAGATVTVTDTSDPDWWQGKSYGHVGYFPSKYVAKLYPGEKPLQMTHTIQVSDGDSKMGKTYSGSDCNSNRRRNRWNNQD